MDRLNFISSKDVEVIPAVPVSMTVPVFGNRVFANDQVKIRILEWALTQ